MIQIRNGVFETNSSSSHSIVISKQSTPADVSNSWYIDDDGVINIDEYETEFNWGVAILADWYHRMLYALASLGEKYIDEIGEAVQKHFPNFKGFDFKFDTSYLSVDHQSVGILRSAMSKYCFSVEDFIFDDRYLVFVDHDNHEIIVNSLLRHNIIHKEDVDVYPCEEEEDDE